MIVVGRNPGEEFMNRYANHPDIEIHANAPDVETFYRRCGSVIVPLLSGGGTRIKIMEAGMACPINPYRCLWI